jgi:crossover junction endodeoxyribonuclease RuvC
MTDIYIGIDPGSKNCALVAWSPTEGLITTWKPKGTMPTGVMRLRKLNLDISTELCKLAKKGRIAKIAMEGYSMFEKFGQHNSGEVGGVIKLTILSHFGGGRREAAYPILVAPQQLKKFATGNGNTKKELITKEVLKRWDVDFDDANLADAYILARIACAADTMPEELLQFQRDVLKALEGRTERPKNPFAREDPKPRQRLVRIGRRKALTKLSELSEGLPQV